MDALRILGNIAKALITTLLVLLMLAAVLTFLAPRFGWRVDAVLSGSMEPALSVGGAVVVSPVEPAEITIGDIITFYSPLNKQLITHRVMAIEEKGFRTKGDANESPDPFLVPAENVVGRVHFHLPYLGYAASFVQTKTGAFLTLFVPGLIIIAAELSNIWQVLAEQEKKSRAEKERLLADAEQSSPGAPDAGRLERL